VTTGDWTKAPCPSWIASIMEGIRPPGAVLAWADGVLQGLRETRPCC